MFTVYFLCDMIVKWIFVIYMQLYINMFSEKCFYLYSKSCDICLFSFYCFLVIARISFVCYKNLHLKYLQCIFNVCYLLVKGFNIYICIYTVLIICKKLFCKKMKIGILCNKFNFCCCNLLIFFFFNEKFSFTFLHEFMLKIKKQKY